MGDAPRCASTIQAKLGTLQCMLEPEHDGSHFGGSEFWGPTMTELIAWLEQEKLNASAAEEWQAVGAFDRTVEYARTGKTLASEPADTIASDHAMSIFHERNKLRGADDRLRATRQRLNSLITFPRTEPIPQWAKLRLVEICEKSFEDDGPAAVETIPAPSPSELDAILARVEMLEERQRHTDAGLAVHVHDRGMHQQRGGK